MTLLLCRTCATAFDADSEEYAKHASHELATIEGTPKPPPEVTAQDMANLLIRVNDRFIADGGAAEAIKKLVRFSLKTREMVESEIARGHTDGHYP